MKKLAVSFILMSVLSIGCKGAVLAPAATTTQPTAVTAPTKSATPATQDASIKTAEQALAKLKEGNARFLADQTAVINVNAETRKLLVTGQHPYAIIISCSDSRVTPSHVFNAGLGELFEIRVAGNVLDDNALGSIEYGAEHLNVPLIVVMGHEKCGAVTATFEAVTQKKEVEGYIASLIKELKPCIEETKAASVEEAAHQNVKDVVAEIKKDKIIAELIKEGKVKVSGAYYTLDGKVTFEE